MVCAPFFQNTRYKFSLQTRTPFVRTYQFKKQAGSKGWNPTPCLPR